MRNKPSTYLLRAGFTASLATLVACGGGGSDDATPVVPPTPEPTTTSVKVTVIDGAIKNALVCLDKNRNGLCDEGEPQGRTAEDGTVSLEVPKEDAGQYPVVASVGTDAVDADHGPVTVAFRMSAPADQVAVVSPLTTLVQQVVASTGATTTEAAAVVQQATGIAASPLADYTKQSAPTDGTANPSTIARAVVLVTQQQLKDIANAVGTTAADGTTVTQAAIDTAVLQRVTEVLPQIVAAVSGANLPANATPAEKDAALAPATAAVVESAGIKAEAVAAVVAAQNTTGSNDWVVSAGASLRALQFFGKDNYIVSMFAWTASQAKPDANGLWRYTERRHRALGPAIARWGSGGEPHRGSDLHWNGTAWANCALGHENTSTVPDALRNSSYDYCGGREKGRSNRTTLDISDKSMADVVKQAEAAGYTNIKVHDLSALGTAKFPAGSVLNYQTSTPLTTAVGYYPSGAGNPIGTGNVVSRYSAAVSAGGDATAQAQGEGCNSTETFLRGAANVATLEEMIAAMSGTPCRFAQGQLVYRGVTYTSDTRNDWWSNSTASLGKLGSAPLSPPAGTKAGYYTGNRLFRVAFAGGTSTDVRYLECKERLVNGSTRNCVEIGKGSYVIETLGNGSRTMSFTNRPAQLLELNSARVFVERDKHVYFGYRSNLTVNKTARLNAVAMDALFTQLGIPTEDWAAPIALTAASYAGVWDLRFDTVGPDSQSGAAVLTIDLLGNGSCREPNGIDCSLKYELTDAATGAFSLRSVDGGFVAQGKLDFLTGALEATFTDNNSTPQSGRLVGQRR